MIDFVRETTPEAERTDALMKLIGRGQRFMPISFIFNNTKNGRDTEDRMNAFEGMINLIREITPGGIEAQNTAISDMLIQVSALSHSTTIGLDYFNRIIELVREVTPGGAEEQNTVLREMIERDLNNGECILSNASASSPETLERTIELVRETTIGGIEEQNAAIRTMLQTMEYGQQVLAATIASGNFENCDRIIELIREVNPASSETEQDAIILEMIKGEDSLLPDFLTSAEDGNFQQNWESRLLGFEKVIKLVRDLTPGDDHEKEAAAAEIRITLTPSVELLTRIIKESVESSNITTIQHVIASVPQELKDKLLAFIPTTLPNGFFIGEPKPEPKPEDAAASSDAMAASEGATEAHPILKLVEASQALAKQTGLSFVEAAELAKSLSDRSQELYMTSRLKLPIQTLSLISEFDGLDPRYAKAVLVTCHALYGTQQLSGRTVEELENAGSSIDNLTRFTNFLARTLQKESQHDTTSNPTTSVKPEDASTISSAAGKGVER